MKRLKVAFIVAIWGFNISMFSVLGIRYVRLEWKRAQNLAKGPIAEFTYFIDLTESNPANRVFSVSNGSIRATIPMEDEMTESWDDSNDERRRILDNCPAKLRGHFTNLFLTPVRKGLREPQQIVDRITYDLERKLTRWGSDENNEEYLTIIASYGVEALDFASWALWYHSLSPEQVAARKQKRQDDFRREWMSSQPATDKQISYLRRLGYDGEVISKQEASELITNFTKGR